MIFLIREWVVQQQPDLAFVEVPGGIGNIAELEHPPEEPPVGEVQENERQDDEFPNAQMLDAAYGRGQTVYPEEQQSDEDQPQNQPIPAPRPIAPLRRRRAFPRPEESNEAHQGVGTGSTFGGQGQVLGASPAAPSSFQFDTSNPRRPQVNREVMAQAAELRREEQFGPNYLEKFARSPPGTLQNVAPLKRNDILDDDSDWEDEEDEATDNKYKSPQRNSKNKASPSTTTLRSLKGPPIAPGSVMEKHPELEDKAYPNFSAWPPRPDYDPPKVIFGANYRENKGVDLFGDWEKPESAFAKPFQFTAADVPNKPLLEPRLLPVTPSSIWRSGVELDVGPSPPLSVSDKGKGKAIDSQAEARANKTTINELMSVDDFLSRISSKEDDPSDAMSIADTGFRSALLDEELARSSTDHGKWGLDEGSPYPYDNSSDKIMDEESEDLVTQILLPTGTETEIMATSEPGPIDPVQPVPVAPVAPAQIPARPAGAGMGGIGWIDWLLGDIPRADVRNAGRGLLDEVEVVAGPNPVPNVEGNADGWNGAAVLPEDVAEAQDNVGDGADGAAAPVDIDEGDDFDGIMELVGMRGSIFGLLQNAAISLVLITAAVMLGVAIPYIWGRIILTILAHPILFTVVIPWSLAVFCANLLIDTVLGVACYGIFAVCVSTRFLLNLGWSGIPAMGSTITNLMHNYASDAWRRVAGKLTTLALILASDRTSPENMSLVTVHSETSHAWLASRQPWARATLAMSWLSEKISASANLTSNASYRLQVAAQDNKTAPEVLYNMFEDLIGIWKEPSVKQGNTTYMFPVVSEAEEALVEFSNSSSWTAADRVMAVIAGYVLFTIVGAWYLSKHKSQPGSYRRQLEKTSIELLQQAGGVMKVILIIGIEMFVFPLYCGLLLGKASVMSTCTPLY